LRASSFARRGVLLALLPAILLSCPFRDALALDAPGGITRAAAVEAALRNHPAVALTPFELSAADGRILQSSKRPNPEVDVEIASFGGSYPATARSEATATLSQVVENGKRAPRIRRSESGKAVLLRDREAARLDVVAGAMRAFVTLQGAQKRRALVGEAHGLAEALKRVATERVAAGAVSPIEETRAGVALSLAAADLVRADREVEEARRGLAEAMGCEAPTFGSAAGDLPESLEVPSEADLVAGLPANPDLSRWDAERAQREAAVEVERAVPRPDVTLRGGIRYEREESLRSFVVGFSLPLPVSDRNEGAVREARANLAGVDPERRAVLNRLMASLSRAHAAMAAAAAEARMLKDVSLAGAQGAYDAVDEGYRLGKFRYLDVLDAGKALVETRLRYVEALVNLNLARIDADRLAARLPAAGGPTPAAAEGDRKK
jgi:cobalt-zinc-cadmium efflux system outer membrane protein